MYLTPRAIYLWYRKSSLWTVACGDLAETICSWLVLKVQYLNGVIDDRCAVCWFVFRVFYIRNKTNIKRNVKGFTRRFLHIKSQHFSHCGLKFVVLVECLHSLQPCFQAAVFTGKGLDSNPLWGTRVEPKFRWKTSDHQLTRKKTLETQNVCSLFSKILNYNSVQSGVYSLLCTFLSSWRRLFLHVGNLTEPLTTLSHSH